MAIAIVGMLDEREEALGLIRDRIAQRGHATCLLDISIGTGAIAPVLKADVTSAELVALGTAARAGAAPAPVSRGTTSTAVMSEGVKAKILDLHRRGQLDGIIAITGMTGALIVLPAMKELPFGVPKLLISGATSQPIHAAKFGSFFSARDITVMHTVVDTVGMNPLVRALALRGADAISGMADGGPVSMQGEKPSIGVTEFGYCDTGAYHLRQHLQDHYEIISIHAMGVGDRAALELAPQGVFTAFIDLVPGSFSEHLLGGNRDAGPGRLDVATTLDIPYIFCPGGLDIISCGPLERRDAHDPLWESRRLAERKLYLEEPPRVQARTSPEELEQVAVAVAEALGRYEKKSRVKVVLPLRGFSSLSVEGAPLYDPESDLAFCTAIKSHLDPAIEVTEVDFDINTTVFAAAVVDALMRAFEEVTG